MKNDLSDGTRNGLPANVPYYDEEGNLHVTVITGGSSIPSPLFAILPTIV